MNFRFSQPSTKIVGAVRLPEDIYLQVKKVSKERNCTMNEVIRVFVEAALEE